MFSGIINFYGINFCDFGQNIHKNAFVKKGRMTQRWGYNEGGGLGHPYELCKNYNSTQVILAYLIGKIGRSFGYFAKMSSLFTVVAKIFGR